MPEESSPSEKEVLDLIRNRTAQPLDEEEFDPTVYGHDEEYVEKEDLVGEEPPTTEEKGEPETAEPEISEDLGAVLARLEALERENRRLREEEEKRREEDFQRLLATKKPEEQVELIKQYYQDRERRQRLENIRLRLEREYPLAASLASPLLSYFDLEVDDPEAYERAMAALNEEYQKVIEDIVRKRIKEETDRTNREKAKGWDLSGLGGTAPRPPATVSPQAAVAKRYEEHIQKLASKKQALLIDELQDLIRLREQLKR